MIYSLLLLRGSELCCKKLTKSNKTAGKTSKLSEKTFLIPARMFKTNSGKGITRSKSGHSKSGFYCSNCYLVWILKQQSFRTVSREMRQTNMTEQFKDKIFSDFSNLRRDIISCKFFTSEMIV